MKKMKASVDAFELGALVGYPIDAENIVFATTALLGTMRGKSRGEITREQLAEYVRDTQLGYPPPPWPERARKDDLVAWLDAVESRTQ